MLFSQEQGKLYTLLNIWGIKFFLII
jgi:hypothetical protein